MAEEIRPQVEETMQVGARVNKIKFPGEQAGLAALGVALGVALEVALEVEVLLLERDHSVNGHQVERSDI